MYHIRQVGDVIWWNGMSDYRQEHDEIGREFNNVAKGRIKYGLIGMEFADVPRGTMWGDGNLSLVAEGDADGNLQIRRMSGDFGGTVFTPASRRWSRSMVSRAP